MIVYIIGAAIALITSIVALLGRVACFRVISCSNLNNKEYLIELAKYLIIIALTIGYSF